MTTLAPPAPAYIPERIDVGPARPLLVLPAELYRRNRRPWLQVRTTGIGASDAAAVLGLSPWESPLSLWVDKRRAEVTDEASEAMRWGQILENPVAREMAARHGLRIAPTPGVLAHPDRLWQLATVDRLVVDRTTGRTVAPFEVKTSSAYKAEEWPADGEPPIHVTVQVQHQMDVGGWDHGYIAALIGGNSPRFWRVERDDVLIGALRTAEEQFWQQVLDGTPPDPIGIDADDDAIASLFTASDREAVLTADEAAMWARRQHLAGRIKVMDQERKRLGQELLLAVSGALSAAGDDAAGAKVARHPDSGRKCFNVISTPGGVASFDEKRLKAERPDIHAQYAGRKPRNPYLMAARGKDAHVADITLIPEGADA